MFENIFISLDTSLYDSWKILGMTTSKDKNKRINAHFRFFKKRKGAQYRGNVPRNRRIQSKIVAACYASDITTFLNSFSFFA